MKFSRKEFFSKCDQICILSLIWSSFTEEVFNGKLHFLCSGHCTVFYSDITEVDLMFFLLISNKFRTSLLRNYSRPEEANDYQNLAELQLKLQQGSNWEMKIKLLIARFFKIFGWNFKLKFGLSSHSFICKITKT